MPSVALAAAPKSWRWLAFAKFAGSVPLSELAAATGLSAPAIGSDQVEIRLGPSYLLSLKPIRFSAHGSDIGADLGTESLSRPATSCEERIGTGTPRREGAQTVRARSWEPSSEAKTIQTTEISSLRGRE